LEKSSTGIEQVLLYFSGREGTAGEERRQPDELNIYLYYKFFHKFQGKKASSCVE
jgi:hypothetical protein